ncbi:flagellar basal-body rod protein FlgF [Alginatibacterium sediminis]|uniref:Flagellar basal-body rod protein FlgF n=1 Tax=Alginatibacterium sediminis TaxID=2164068 RepID=A0A420EGD8_9ALTE|nr:flagellar basal-body rod protein FlgF [Alginatibacterium sediminis]RKF19626.1 flagellar basal-body rod protein FlgF [Alginatibacterium sediminis]
MDRLLYISMTGAKENMNALALRGNNLANANTTGFKADIENARAMQAFGEGLPTRVFALTEKASENYTQGMLRTTGRDLDVAVKGDGWISVQDAGGEEALTRNGNFEISAAGVLQTSNGLPVLGNGNQPIVIPLPVEKLEIHRDGTIEIQPEGALPNALEEINRIKLSKPENPSLEKGEDGLFRSRVGEQFVADATVSVEKGALESSNVNPVQEMTHMMSLQRHYELQVKMMKTAEETDKASSSLLRLT